MRNKAYDSGLFLSHKFDLPVISIGNLAAGGAGKSPMAEYIILRLKDRYKVATLSRGYGRKTKGFRRVETISTSEESGDEPLQFKNKFPKITVSVSEDRATGIEQLKADHEVIIMDDAFQHRRVTAGLNILLFDYNQLFDFQWFLPTGNLREPLSGRKRADIIVITKTPYHLAEAERERIIKRVNPYEGQEVFFSYIEYSQLVQVNGSTTRPLTSITKSSAIILLTGIANADPLIKELKNYSSSITHHQYPDHHDYSRKNILKLAQAFQDLKTDEKLIITTEKDMQRLRTSPDYELLSTFPVYYLPISANIHEPKERFNRIIETYVTKHTNHYRIY
jgi:tetraacyldisaccharide 4'-kinase